MYMCVSQHCCVLCSSVKELSHAVKGQKGDLSPSSVLCVSVCAGVHKHAHVQSAYRAKLTFVHNSYIKGALLQRG